MSDPIIDTLIPEGEVREVTSQQELADLIESDVKIALDLSNDPNDSIRISENARKFHDQFKPIKVTMSQTDIGIIKKPTFISPPNNGAISKYACVLETSVFEDTHINKDTHKQSLWQVSLEPTFSSLVWSFASFIFKSTIEVPAEFLNFNTSYYVRVKYYGHKYTSEWSEPIRVNTLDAYIEKPIFLSPTPTELISRQQAVLTASAFKTIPANITTQATAIWEVHRNANFTDLVWFVESGTDLNQVTIPPNQLTYNQPYYARVRYKGVRGLSEWSNALKLNINYDIIKPSILSPVNNTEVKIYEVNLVGTPFTTDPGLVAPMEFAEWEISEESNFTNSFYHNKKPGIVTELLVPKELLSFNKKYYARVRYWGEKAISAWSETIAFTIAQIKINKPTLLTPTEDSVISRLALKLVTSDYETDPPFMVDHKFTIFEIYNSTVLNSTNKVWEYNAASNLYNVQVPASVLSNDKTYYARVKFKSLTFESDWSDLRMFKTFKLANILTPQLIKREITSLAYGEDPERVIGHVTCQREMIDPYDAIVWGKWRIAKDINFSEGVQEKVFSNNPDRLPINLNTMGDAFSPFLPDTNYYIKAAFKSLASSDFSAFTDVVMIKTGMVKDQEVVKWEVINPDYSNNQLCLTVGPFKGTEDYNEYMTRAQIVIASDIEFTNILETFNIDKPSLEILTGQSLNIVGTIYAKARFYGHYFGVTPFTPIVTLNTGGIVRPSITEGTMTYELVENVPQLKFSLKSDEFLLSENRKDNHKKSNWIFYKDINKTQILHETGWIDSLTALTINITQEYIGNVYVGVKYQGYYFQSSELSELFQFLAPGHITKPQVSQPETDQQIFKTAVNLACLPYMAQTGLIHTASSWKITSDLMGENIVWSDIDSADLLTKTNIGSTLTSGMNYYAWVQHKSNATISEWSEPVKFYLIPSIAKPSITNLSSTEPNNTNGGDISLITSAFVIDPEGYQPHNATLWEIALDASFQSLSYVKTDTSNLTAWNIPGGLFNTSSSYWVRFKFLGTTLFSDYSEAIQLNIPNSPMLEPGTASILPSTSIGPDLSTATITFSNLACSGAATLILTSIELKYVDPITPETVYAQGYIYRTDDSASLTYTLDQIINPTEVFGSVNSVKLLLRYRSGNLVSPWQDPANGIILNYTAP